MDQVEVKANVEWRWLTLGLEVLGAGAKTAVGYGQMLPSKKQPAARPTADDDAAVANFREWFGDGARFRTEDMSKKSVVQQPIVDRLNELRTNRPAAFEMAAAIVRGVLSSSKQRSRALTDLVKPS